MSIIEGDGKEVVKVSAIWSLAFKFLLALTPVVGTVGLAWSIWVTTSIYSHSETLAVIKTMVVVKPLSRESVMLDIEQPKKGDVKSLAEHPTRK